MLRSRPATPRVDPAPETGVHVGFAGMQQTRAADVAPTPRWLTLLGLPIRGDDPDAGFHVITEDGDFLVDESGAFVIHD
jgi:hypothetical protein